MIKKYITDITIILVCLSIDFGIRPQSGARQIESLHSNSSSSLVLGDEIIEATEGPSTPQTQTGVDENQISVVTEPRSSSSSSSSSFDLLRELIKIECDIFFEDLRSAGYDNQVHR